MSTLKRKQLFLHMSVTAVGQSAFGLVTLQHDPFQPDVALHVHRIDRADVDAVRVLGDAFAVHGHHEPVGVRPNRHVERPARHKVREYLRPLFAIPPPAVPGVAAYDIVRADDREARIQMERNRRVRPNVVAVLQIDVERVRQQLDGAVDVDRLADSQRIGQPSVVRHFLRTCCVLVIGRKQHIHTHTIAFPLTTYSSPVCTPAGACAACRLSVSVTSAADCVTTGCHISAVPSTHT